MRPRPGLRDPRERNLPDAKLPRKSALESIPDAATLSALARTDFAQAARALAAMSPDQVIETVLSLAPDERERLLVLVEHPDEVVPLLPEAELATTMRATGLADAGWLVEHATPEQRVAGIDLDVWRDTRLSHARLTEWIDALIEAGDDTLIAALDELDPELWIAALQEMAEFYVLGSDTKTPEGFHTDDGVVWYDPQADADGERVRAILDAARVSGQYWQLAWGASCEDREDVEEWAQRWKAARMSDLGFPDHEQAMRVYRPLHVDAAPVVDVSAGDDAADVVRAQRRRGTRLQQALGELPEARSTEILSEVLGAANAIAVADELSLTEPESQRRSLAKAMLGIELGLAHVVRARDQAPDRVLDETPARDLFRIGVTLEPRLGRTKTLQDLDDLDSDWAVELFVLEDED